MGDITSLGLTDMDGPNKLFLGSFIHSSALDALEYLHNAAVCVDGNGKIVAVERDCDLAKAEQDLLPKLGWTKQQTTITTCKEGQFFFPGFIGELCFPPKCHGPRPYLGTLDFS